MKSTISSFLCDRLLTILIAFFLSSDYVLSFNFQTNVPRYLQKSNVASLEMKGKGSKVPINQRGEYLKQQRMMELKKQMESTKDEGVPVFKVYVRPKAGGLWIPCGDLGGDKRAKSLVEAWMSGFLADTYKTQIDQGIARSIISQEDTFVTNIIENYKPFRKFKKEDLVFGYKVEYPGMLTEFV